MQQRQLIPGLIIVLILLSFYIGFTSDLFKGGSIGAFIFSDLTSEKPTYNVVSEPGTSINVFFCPDECYKPFYSIIANASSSIHCALFELSSTRLIGLLNNKSMNIDVKVVVDNDHYSKVANLSFIHHDYSKAFTHNKFCIVDNRTVITGSMNPTDNGFFFNNNNIVILNSYYLVENYNKEFDELWNSEFGTGKKVEFPLIQHGSTLLENYFCPEDNCRQHLLELIAKANYSVYFMAFSFTDNTIGDLLLNKSLQGVRVRGIVESRSINKYSEYYKLDSRGLVLKDSNPKTMHNKVFIIDNSTVITGSYNPTKKANNYNDENILVIHNKMIANSYLTVYDHLAKCAAYQDLDYPYNISGAVCTYLPPYLENISGASVKIAKINYNPEGPDFGREYVTIENLINKTLDSYGYKLSDTQHTILLRKILLPYSAINITSGDGLFVLPNSRGKLILYGFNTLQEVKWGKE